MQLRSYRKVGSPHLPPFLMMSLRADTKTDSDEESLAVQQVSSADNPCLQCQDVFVYIICQEAAELPKIRRVEDVEELKDFQHFRCG